MPEEDDITLPTIQPQPLPLIPPLPPVTSNMPDTEINKMHLQMSNLELNVIYQMWPQVKTIAGVTRLIEASIKAVKHQRDLLCLPYGHSGKATREDVVFPPIDD